MDGPVERGRVWQRPPISGFPPFCADQGRSFALHCFAE